jgi:hypothetical protein
VPAVLGVWVVEPHLLTAAIGGDAEAEALASRPAQGAPARVERQLLLPEPPGSTLGDGRGAVVEMKANGKG